MRDLLTRLTLAASDPSALFADPRTGWLAPLLLLAVLNGIGAHLVEASAAGREARRLDTLAAVSAWRDRVQPVVYERALQQFSRQAPPVDRLHWLNVAFSTVAGAVALSWLLHLLAILTTGRDDVTMTPILTAVTYGLVPIVVGRCILVVGTIGSGEAYFSGALPDLVKFVDWPARDTFAGGVLRGADLTWLWAAWVVGVGVGAAFVVRPGITYACLLLLFAVSLVTTNGTKAYLEARSQQTRGHIRAIE